MFVFVFVFVFALAFVFVFVFEFELDRARVRVCPKSCDCVVGERVSSEPDESVVCVSGDAEATQ